MCNDDIPEITSGSSGNCQFYMSQIITYNLQVPNSSPSQNAPPVPTAILAASAWPPRRSGRHEPQQSLSPLTQLHDVTRSCGGTRAWRHWQSGGDQGTPPARKRLPAVAPWKGLSAGSATGENCNGDAPPHVSGSQMERGGPTRWHGEGRSGPWKMNTECQNIMLKKEKLELNAWKC